MHQNYKYFSFITGIFCACLVISNVLDEKPIQIGSAIFPGGDYPVSDRVCLW